VTDSNQTTRDSSTPAPVLVIDRQTQFVHRATCPLLRALPADRAFEPLVGLEFVASRSERLCPCIGSVLATMLAQLYASIAAAVDRDALIGTAEALMRESAGFETYIDQVAEALAESTAKSHRTH